MMGSSYEFYVEQGPERRWRRRMIEGFPNGPGVYVIICRELGEAYIGASKRVKARVRDQLRLMAHPYYGASHPFREQYTILGAGAFEVELLETVASPSLLMEREAAWRKKKGEEFYIVGSEVVRSHGGWANEEDTING
jgi:hypothetical protein